MQQLSKKEADDLEQYILSYRWFLDNIIDYILYDNGEIDDSFMIYSVIHGVDRSSIESMVKDLIDQIDEKKFVFMKYDVSMGSKAFDEIQDRCKKCYDTLV